MFIAGSYYGTITSSNTSWMLGKVQDGFTLTETRSAEDILTDDLGDSKVDGVYRGGNCFLSFIASEVHAEGIIRLKTPSATQQASTTTLMTDDAAVNTLTATPGYTIPAANSALTAAGLATFGAVQRPGELETSHGYILTLTALWSTTGAYTVAKTWTFPMVNMANGHTVEQALANRHRKIPIRLQCLPTVQTVNSVAGYYWYVLSNS